MTPLRAAILGFLSLNLLGCSSWFKPTRAEQVTSYEIVRPALRVAESRLLACTFLLFASDTPLEITVSSGQKLHLSAAGRRGLAVAVESDGYLLTAAHVAGTYAYVYGPFDGVLALRRARLVRREQSRPFGAEVALLKVDAPVVPASLDAPGSAGDAVVAVVTEMGPALRLHLAGGQIAQAEALPDGAYRLHTNVPLWFGDSGGPLFSTEGVLRGVNTAFRRGAIWSGFATTHFAYAPACEQLAAWIQEDRLAESAASPAR